MAVVAAALALTAALSACDDTHGTTPALKYSTCMRAHGITDFPDPQPNGSIDIDQAPGSAPGDLDASNPTFIKADAACKPHLPQESPR